MCFAVGGQCFGFCRRFNGRNRAKRWISGDSRNQFGLRNGLSFDFLLGCRNDVPPAPAAKPRVAAIAIMTLWCIECFL